MVIKGLISAKSSLGTTQCNCEYYYPHRMVMDEMNFVVNGTYRFGFNGKERDSENFEGAYDFGARILDARLGWWMSVDPLTNAFIGASVYSFALNQPIIAIDFGGNGPVYVVYSPALAEKTNNALNNKNYEEVLRIVEYGLNNGFVDAQGNPSDFISNKVGKDVMPIECQGISQVALENVFVFELYSLNNDGTYTSVTKYAEIPVSSSTLKPNFTSIEKKFWSDWSAEKEAAFKEWKEKNSSNTGGEHTDQTITNNDEETLRQLFDNFPDQDIPESPAYGKEPLFGYPTPEFNSNFSNVDVGQEFFKPGVHGGAYKYTKISDTQYEPAYDFKDASGNKTNWTGNEESWQNYSIADGGAQK